MFMEISLAATLLAIPCGDIPNIEEVNPLPASSVQALGRTEEQIAFCLFYRANGRLMSKELAVKHWRGNLGSYSAFSFFDSEKRNIALRYWTKMARRIIRKD